MPIREALTIVAESKAFVETGSIIDVGRKFIFPFAFAERSVVMTMNVLRA